MCHILYSYRKLKMSSLSLAGISEHSPTRESSVLGRGLELERKPVKSKHERKRTNSILGSFFKFGRDDTDDSDKDKNLMVNKDKNEEDGDKAQTIIPSLTSNPPPLPSSPPPPIPSSPPPSLPTGDTKEVIVPVTTTTSVPTRTTKSLFSSSAPNAAKRRQSIARVVANPKFKPVMPPSNTVKEEVMAEESLKEEIVTGESLKEESSV